MMHLIHVFASFSCFLFSGACTEACCPGTLYIEGRKCAVIREPIKNSASKPGVNNPQTGHSAKMNANVAITPTAVAVGIMRGQYTLHSRCMRLMYGK